MLDRVGRDVWRAVALYCDIRSVFAARGVARALRAALSPAAAPRVWVAVRPPRWELNRQLLCRGATPQALELLRTLYGYSSEDLRGRADTTTPLHYACTEGATDRAAWLLLHGEFSRHYVMNDTFNPFVLACMHGHLAAAQLLATHCDITPTEVRKNENRVLQLVSERGHLPVAQWLVEHFGLDARDARAPWVVACQAGNLAAVRWLDTRFEFALTDLGPLSPYDTNTRFIDACQSGNLELVQWMVSRFELTATDATFSNAKALRLSCYRGHLDVARWLVAHFRMDVRLVRDCRELVNIARGYLFEKVALWLESELEK
jgi:ankyrin repeat protein